MANLNTVTLADNIKTEYERRLLTRALPRLVHGRWSMQARLNKYGSYELRKYGSLSAVTTPLTEGATPSEQAAPSLTLTTITPTHYGAWLGITDLVEMESFDPIISEASAILGEQAGNSADQIIRDVLVAGATKDYSGDQSARASLDAPAHNVSYADFIKQVAALETQNARPADGAFYAVVIHPDTWASLMQDPTFVNMFVQETSDDPIRTGYLGTILRCKLYVSSNAKEYADTGVGSTTDVYSMLFIAKEAYGTLGMAGLEPNLPDAGQDGFGNMTGQTVKPVDIIVKQVGSEGSGDPLNQRGSIGWRMSLTATVLNSSWIRDLEHTTVFSDD